MVSQVQRPLPFQLVFLLASLICVSAETEQAPKFTSSFPLHYDFSNSTGGKLSCTASGDPLPTITWLMVDGSPATQVQNLRRIRSDGTLSFPSFGVDDYRQDVHGVSYRCSATNTLGTIISNEIKVKGVVGQEFAVHVYDVYSMKGNIAVMRCHIPKFLQPLVNVTAWIKDSVVSITSSTVNANSKYIFLPSGELIIKDVDSNDALTSYRCQVFHRLSGETKTNVNPGRLIVTESQGKVPPNIIFSNANIVIKKDERMFLPCVANGHPTPSYKWFKEDVNGKFELIHSNEHVEILPGSLIIDRVKVADSGKYMCIATNEVNSNKVFIHVRVLEPLNVIVRPSKATVDANNAQSLHCNVIGSGIYSITWFKDGKLLPTEGIVQTNNETLEIFSMSNEFAGLYQCFANNEMFSSYSTAVIKLGDTLPTIFKGFEEQVLKPGSNLLLQCTSQGNPIPQFQWTLDNVNLDTQGRININMQTDGKNHVVSSLKISGLKVEDGGVYKCIAKSKTGFVHHSSRINIIGSLGMRSNIKYHAIEDGNVNIDCPVYGYPIESIQWSKDGQLLPLNKRHSIPENGTLIIHNVKRQSDKGKYTCIVQDDSKDELIGEIELIVMVPPKITPFSFQDELIREGARARIQCVVREGDSPLKINWLRDGHFLTKGEGINIHDLDEFSSILMISSINPRHNGNYTCLATNPAGSSRHTAALFINVPPKVVPFTFQDEHLSEGMLVRVSCVVSRGDLPISITWLKDDRVIPSELLVSIKEFDEYSSVLSIDPVKLKHSGNYTCIAQNHAGASTHTAQLTIQVPLRWKLEPQNTVVKSGQNLWIDCQAEGFPEPSVTWEKSKKKYLVLHELELLENNGRIRIFENGTLKFESIQKSDAGYYVCIANNNIQQSLSKVISIAIQAAPDFTQNYYDLKVRRGEDVEIVCEANGNWPIFYTWSTNGHTIDMQNTRYKIEDKDDKSNQKSTSVLRISWVDKKDSTNFVCEAKNDIGQSKLTVNLLVLESPEAPVINLPLRVENQTVFLNWTLAYTGNSEITRYIIVYKKDVDRWETNSKILTSSGIETVTKISNLKPAVMYNFRLMAENDIGNSSWSDIVTAKTEENVPDGPPENVEVESIDANTLRVTWKPPKKHLWNGAIRGYNIGYKIHNSVDDLTITTLEVPEDYTEELIYQLTDLNMYTQYDVIIQAYNSKGKGPNSEPVLAMTSEDIPSSAPEDVRCSSLSSRSIYVLWKPPSADTINGILRGYKVLYKPTAEWYDAMIQSKIVDTSKITINNLEVNTNYSIQVLAFTKVGDGVKSEAMYCKTHEDVPESPEAIKVLPSSSDSVVVAWKPPHKSNGALTKYNVYYKPIEENQKFDIQTQNTEELQRDAMIHSSTISTQSIEIKGLKKNKKYAFWVTANSAIGESSASTIVAQTVADSIVPAKAASFDTIVKTPWQEDIMLPCIAVGVPSPNRKWTMGEQIIKETSRLKFTSDGSVIISKAASEDSGNYSCSVYNEHGRDEVTYFVAVQVPPSAPVVEVISKTRSSIKLQWKQGISGGESIRGYLLHFREINGIWQTKEIRADQVLYTLDNLACGTSYHLYMEAFNNIGTGSSSDTITVTSEGADVATPTKDQIIREGSTFVSVHLEAWPSTGCPVKSFSAEYKSVAAREWIVAGSNIRPTQKKLVISNLKPATWYSLRLSVDSNSKPTVAEYKFATHTATGATLAPDSFEESLVPVYIFYLDPLIFIPAVALLIVVIIASVVVCFYFKRRNGSVGTPSDISDATTHPGINTWIRHSHTLPRGHFGHGHASTHSTLSRRSADPSPYATSHLTDFFHPEHGKVSMRPDAAIHLFHDQSFQQARPAQVSSKGEPMNEMNFIFPNNQEQLKSQLPTSDGYDPPPRSHMIPNSRM